MAERRLVDARLFWAEHAHLDWPALARRREARGDGDAGSIPGRNADLRQVGLRWHVNADEHAMRSVRRLGLPTGPFTVWRREPFGLSDFERPLTATLVGGLHLDMRLVVFDRTVATVAMRVQSPNGGLVIGLGKAPEPRSIVTWEEVHSGTADVRLAAGRLNGLLIPRGMRIDSIAGSDPNLLANELEWERVEIVGMPVDGSWSGIGDHLSDQGLIGALTDPIDAAVDRLLRGAPPFGWGDHAEPGVLAPPWLVPDPFSVIDEVHADLLPQMQDVLQLPQTEQTGHRATRPMKPPETLQGDAMQGTASDALIPSVALLQLAVAGDPLLSLALGYGTNLPEERGFGDDDDRGRGPRWDYMITAPYREGIGFSNEPIELASLALRAKPGFPPFVATQIASWQQANLAPDVVDGSWHASTRTRWDRALDMAAVRTASHAVARHEPGETNATAMLSKRPSQGHYPINPAVAEDDPEPNFVHFADRDVEMPNQPGQRTLRYSVANQSIFGVWSSWQTSETTVRQPPPTVPAILSADFDVEAPDSGTACPAALTVDITWDWTDRRPKQLRLVGRMFAAADRSTPVPNTSPPSGLERSIATAGDTVRLDFTGDTAIMTGAPAGSQLSYLDQQGEQEVTPGAAQDGPADSAPGPRRYRLRIEGLVADFAAANHIGLALWASSTERIAPQRVAAMDDPFYAYSSDPIAPAVPPELVPLSSLPDAEGRSHARISWPPVGGAAAYVVYGSDEITMRAHYGLGEPDLDETLSDRVTELLDAWVADPDRRPFTRLVPKPVTGTSVDVALPRGTMGISTFVIVSLSAGQVEGPWPDASSPTLRDEVIVRATPRIAAPATPEIEARVDGQTVHLTVRTRPGHRVGRIDVHRVRVDGAARELDTMGPPIASVSESTAGWTVETDVDGTPRAFHGTDTPGPTWRRVWYRAVAWADKEWPVAGQPFQTSIAERGLVEGRSPGSNTVSVVVPPPDPPDLSPIDISWPGGGSLADVLLSWTTAAPFTAPLGAHSTEIDVRGSASQAALISESTELADIPVTAPTAGDGAWRVDGSEPARFIALIRRADVDEALEARVTIIDPRGRASHERVRVDAGPVLPAPELDDLDVFDIVGRGTILTFTSSSPITRFGEDAYQLRVSAVRRIGWPPFATRDRAMPGDDDAAALPPIRPGHLAEPEPPQPGAEWAGGSDAPSTDAQRSNVDLVRPEPGAVHDLLTWRRPIVIEVDLPDVAVDRGQPAIAAPLQVRRMRGSGPDYSYSVLATVKVRHFTLQLRSPDGRIASASTREAPR